MTSGHHRLRPAARTGGARELVEAAAAPGVGRRCSAVALVVATAAGVWMGVDAPDTSPVDGPTTVAAQTVAGPG